MDLVLNCLVFRGGVSPQFRSLLRLKCSGFRVWGIFCNQKPDSPNFPDGSGSDCGFCHHVHEPEIKLDKRHRAAVRLGSKPVMAL